MKFLKPFLGLFCAIYIPLLIFVVWAAPAEKRAAQASTFAKGLLIIVAPISLGYAALSVMMDAQKRENESRNK
ncbi:MAG TPA: hypothetical protein VK171_13685 [Fimbriimonas sp.]|nr:hypothetical protein [Fimbriimonas sp.]